jgi:hypothetical protein
MTERDHWTENLRCPKCGATGSVELSQENPARPAYRDGSDHDVRVESVSQGFKAVQFEYGTLLLCFLRWPGGPLTSQSADEAGPNLNLSRLRARYRYWPVSDLMAGFEICSGPNLTRNQFHKERNVDLRG